MNNYDKNLEKLTLVMILGACDALDAGVITIDEAEFLVFSPGVMSLMRHHQFSEDTVALIHMGTELENIESLMPEKLKSQLQLVKKLTIEKLACSPELDFSQRKWYREVF